MSERQTGGARTHFTCLGNLIFIYNKSARQCSSFLHVRSTVQEWHAHTTNTLFPNPSSKRHALRESKTSKSESANTRVPRKSESSGTIHPHSARQATARLPRSDPLTSLSLVYLDLACVGTDLTPCPTLSSYTVQCSSRAGAGADWQGVMIPRRHQSRQLDQSRTISIAHDHALAEPSTEE